MPEKKYSLIFSPPVQKAISEIAAKHQVSLKKRVEVFDGVTTKDIEVFIFRVAKRILSKEGSFKDICEKLKKDLGMQEKDAESLAHDIKNNVVVLAQMEQPEEEEEIEELAEAAPQVDDEEDKKELFRKAKEELMRKINARKSVPAPEEKVVEPYKKGPNITDVEDNAKNMQHSQEREVQAPAEKPQPKAVDPYKESVE